MSFDRFSPNRPQSTLFKIVSHDEKSHRYINVSHCSIVATWLDLIIKNVTEAIGKDSMSTPIISRGSPTSLKLSVTSYILNMKSSI